MGKVPCLPPIQYFDVAIDEKVVGSLVVPVPGDVFLELVGTFPGVNMDVIDAVMARLELADVETCVRVFDVGRLAVLRVGLAVEIAVGGVAGPAVDEPIVDRRVGPVEPLLAGVTGATKEQRFLRIGVEHVEPELLRVRFMTGAGGQLVAVFGQVHVQGQGHVAHVAQAEHGFGLGVGLLQGGQQDGNEQGQDGHHDEQLHQCKTV